MDLLSVIPFYFVDIYLLYADVAPSAASSITRVPKMLKLVRLAKLLRVMRASQIFKRWDRWMAQRVQIGCTKLAKSMVLFIWLLHLMACLWCVLCAHHACGVHVVPCHRALCVVNVRCCGSYCRIHLTLTTTTLQTNERTNGRTDAYNE